MWLVLVFPYIFDIYEIVVRYPVRDLQLSNDIL